MGANSGEAKTTLSNITVTRIRPKVNRRKRSWYVQQSGGNSSRKVTLKFNFNDYNLSAAPSASLIFRILYNATDGSFATGTNKLVNGSTSSISGSTVSLAVSAANLASGYYTIIWGSSSVLPIVLSSFDATAH